MESKLPLGPGNVDDDKFNMTTQDKPSTTVRPISKACVGRSFQIGSVYDLQTDDFVKELDSWDNGLMQSLAETTFLTGDASCCWKEMSVHDTLASKARTLGMDRDLEFSVLCGLTQPGPRATAYLSDVHCPDKSVRVVLEAVAGCRSCEVWSCRSCVGRDNDSQGEISKHARSLVSSLGDNASAAHVVLYAEYGTEALCVFTAPIGDRDPAVAAECLQNEVARFAQGLVEHSKFTTEVKLNGDGCDYEDVAMVNEITVKIYSDIDDTGRTDDGLMTLDGAVDFMKLFASKARNSASLVPKRVILTPLVKLAQLDSIEVGTVEHVGQELMDHIRSLETQMQIHCQQLSCNPMVIFDRVKTSDDAAYDICHVPFLIDDAKNLATLSRRALQAYRKETNRAALKIRKNESCESELIGFMKHWEGSGLGPAALTKMVKNISKTGSQIQHLLDNAAGAGIEIVDEKQLKSLTSNMQINSVACLCVNVGVMSVNGVPAARAVLMTNTALMPSVDSLQHVVPEWHQQPVLVARFRNTMRDFFVYATTNESPSTVFVIYFIRMSDSPVAPVFLRIFQNGIEHDLNRLPGPPIDKPALVPDSLHPNGLTLMWNLPTTSPNTVSYYVIRGSCPDDPKCDFETATANESTTFELCELRHGTRYVFSIASATIGDLVSGFGDVSDTISTPTEHRLAIRTRNTSTSVVDTNNKINIFLPRKKLAGGCSNQHAGFQRYNIGFPTPVVPREKVVLVVGATGTGKTTFINSMANVLFEVRPDDDFRFKVITQDDEGQERASSVTKSVTAYTFHDTILSYCLTVIDTPGYGDTEGIKADRHTTGLMKEMFESGNTSPHGVDQLDAVCLVVKASDSRLTAQLRYNLNAVLSLFGSDIIENIFVIVTFSDASEPPVTLALAEAEIQYQAMFKCNNSAFFQGAKSDPDEQAAQAFYWQVGQKSFQQLFNGLENQVLPKSLTLSKEVLTRRQNLTDSVELLHKSIKQGLADLELLRQEKQVVESHKAKIKAHSSFKYEITEIAVEKQALAPGKHTTACLTCNRTCHDSCIFKDDEDKIHCSAMKDGSCFMCPGGANCHWSEHKNLPYLLLPVERKVVKTDEELRAKYALANVDLTSARKLLENMADAFVKTQKHVFSLIKQVNTSLNELRKIAMRPDNMNDADYIDMLIVAEKQDAHPGWKQRIHHLSDQKEFATMIRDAQDPDFDPFQHYKKERWLARFMPNWFK